MIEDLRRPTNPCIVGEDCVCRKATPEEMYELSKDRKHVLSKPDEVAKPNFKGRIMPPISGPGYVGGPEAFQRTQAAHYDFYPPPMSLDGYPVFHNPLLARPHFSPVFQGSQAPPESIKTSMAESGPPIPMNGHGATLGFDPMNGHTASDCISSWQPHSTSPSGGLGQVGELPYNTKSWPSQFTSAAGELEQDFQPPFDWKMTASAPAPSQTAQNGLRPCHGQSRADFQHCHHSSGQSFFYGSYDPFQSQTDKSAEQDGRNDLCTCGPDCQCFLCFQHPRNRTTMKRLRNIADTMDSDIRDSDTIDPNTVDPNTDFIPFYRETQDHSDVGFSFGTIPTNFRDNQNETEGASECQRVVPGPSGFAGSGIGYREHHFQLGVDCTKDFGACRCQKCQCNGCLTHSNH